MRYTCLTVWYINTIRLHEKKFCHIYEMLKMLQDEGTYRHIKLITVHDLHIYNHELCKILPPYYDRVVYFLLFIFVMCCARPLTDDGLAMQAIWRLENNKRLFEICQKHGQQKPFSIKLPMNDNEYVCLNECFLDLKSVLSHKNPDICLSWYYI